MDYILSWYTFWGVIMLLGSGATAMFFLGLWPVVIATLQTSAGRKAILVAIGSFLLWVASIFLYQKGKQAANEALRKNSERLEEESNARRKTLQNIPPDKLTDAAKPWVRDN